MRSLTVSRLTVADPKASPTECLSCQQHYPLLTPVDWPPGTDSLQPFPYPLQPHVVLLASSPPPPCPPPLKPPVLTESLCCEVVHSPPPPLALPLRNPPCSQTACVTTVAVGQAAIVIAVCASWILPQRMAAVPLLLGTRIACSGYAESGLF